MVLPAAFLADIHGNVWALWAVLEELDRRRIPTRVNLGDHFYGPLAPGATAELLEGLDAVTVRGNQDRELIEDPGSSPRPTHLFTLSELQPRHLEWIRSQPPVLFRESTLLCHGTPSNDSEYLLEEVTSDGVHPRRNLVIEGHPSLVACGHSHIPRCRQQGATVFLNPGSVGLPAYSDELPFPHRMETGSPHARFAILDGERVELVAVPYDWQSAREAALRNGRPDWAHAIATGMAL